jgi:hypothetical protein
MCQLLDSMTANQTITIVTEGNKCFSGVGPDAIDSAPCRPYNFDDHSLPWVPSPTEPDVTQPPQRTKHTSDAVPVWLWPTIGISVALPVLLVVLVATAFAIWRIKRKPPAGNYQDLALAQPPAGAEDQDGL